MGCFRPPDLWGNVSVRLDPLPGTLICCAVKEGSFRTRNTEGTHFWGQWNMSLSLCRCLSLWTSTTAGVSYGKILHGENQTLELLGDPSWDEASSNLWYTYSLLYTLYLYTYYIYRGWDLLFSFSSCQQRRSQPTVVAGKHPCQG